MLKRKLVFLIFILSVILSLIDCRCQRPEIIIKSIMLELPANSLGFSNKFDQKNLSLIVKNVISKNKHFQFDESKEGGGFLRLTFYLPSKSSLMVFAHLSFMAHGKSKEYRSFTHIKVTDNSINGAALSDAMGRLLLHLYQVQSGFIIDNEKYLVTLLKASAGEIVEQDDLINAISILADAREKKAVSLLIKLLNQTNDMAVGNACLIALSEVGSEEAMPVIIEYAERKPPLIRRQAIIAAKLIASTLAAEWLLTMAYGHDDPLVRKEAFLALNEVETKLFHEKKIDIVNEN